jgi:hypothetical protein
MKSRKAPGRIADPGRGTGKLEQLLVAGGTRGGRGRRRRDVAGRGKVSGVGRAAAGELEGQVVGLEWRGAAGSARNHRRGAAGGGAEQQRERGERKTTGTCSKDFKSLRGSW